MKKKAALFEEEKCTDKPKKLYIKMWSGMTFSVIQTSPSRS